jgi:hypothetical protein
MENALVQLAAVPEARELAKPVEIVVPDLSEIEIADRQPGDRRVVAATADAVQKSGPRRVTSRGAGRLVKCLTSAKRGTSRVAVGLVTVRPV